MTPVYRVESDIFDTESFTDYNQALANFKQTTKLMELDDARKVTYSERKLTAAGAANAAIKHKTQNTKALVKKVKLQTLRETDWVQNGQVVRSIKLTKVLIDDSAAKLVQVYNNWSSQLSDMQKLSPFTR